MSYVLDGIKTAMEEQEEWLGRARVLCLCEWWAAWDNYDEYILRALPAIRFHYTHCEDARFNP